MASFEIADCPTRLLTKETTAANQRVQQGTLAVTIRNTSERPRTGRVTVETESNAKTEWFSFDGSLPTNPRELERDFAAKGTETVRLNLSVPVGEAPGNYAIRVRVTAEDDPDDDFTVSPNVVFDLVAPTEAPLRREKFPWWAIAVAAGVVLLVVGGGASMFLLRQPEQKQGQRVVPQLIGMSETLASMRLRRLRIPFTRTMVLIGEVGASNGHVVLVEPSAGQPLPPGGRVAMFIGAPTNLYKCPDGHKCVSIVNLPAATQQRIRENMVTIK
jgi:hypothetical protein